VTSPLAQISLRRLLRNFPVRGSFGEIDVVEFGLCGRTRHPLLRTPCKKLASFTSGQQHAVKLLFLSSASCRIFSSTQQYIIIGPGNRGPQWPQTLILLLFLCLFLGLLSDFQSTKTFSFHNRSSLNFAYRLKTIFSTIALCRIFKFSPNQLLVINF